MKHNLVIFSTISIFFAMLLFPQTVFKGASEGLLLWFQTILPTLLPFLIVSDLLIHTHAIDLLSRLSTPLFHRLFRVSDYGSFAVLTGFLCGYPMGSKITADLYRTGYISYSEACYLLSFCNNTSPMFVISYLAIQNLNVADQALPCLFILWVSPFLLSFLFRRIYIHSSLDLEHSTPFPVAKVTGNLLDTSIMNGCETIVKIGGYMMLFSIFTALAHLLPVHTSWTEYLLLPSLEITNGIPAVASSGLSNELKFVLCLALTSFGGWCAAAQTRCVIQPAKLPIFPYIIEKLITASVTSLLAILYLRFLN